jgi:hypothetical protein
MALKEVSMAKDNPEQLSFKAFELADCVRELLAIEYQKKEANEHWNIEIKALKKSIARLSGEIEASKAK